MKQAWVRVQVKDKDGQVKPADMAMNRAARRAKGMLAKPVLKPHTGQWDVKKSLTPDDPKDTDKT